MSKKEFLVDSLVEDGYLKTPLITEAFRAVDRKDFVLPGYLGEAYGDYPLPIGHGQTISQPLTVVFMLELLEPQPGENILDIGSGSGWTTALLAYAVGRKENRKPKTKSEKSGTVVAIERIPELCKFGEKNVGKYDFAGEGVAKFFCGDASLGAPREFLPKMGFDKILAGAAAAAGIPEAWKKQLKTGGRIVAPVGQSVVVFDKISDDKWKTEEYRGFTFVPLIENR